MNKILVSTIACVGSSLAMAGMTDAASMSAQAAVPRDADSVQTVRSMSAYPYRTEITGMRDMDSLIMGGHYKAVRTEAQSLITKAKRKKQSTEAYQKALDVCAKAERGLRGVDRVVIIDSVVVGKHDFLSAYTLTDEMGTLRLSRDGEKVYYYTQLNGIAIGADRVVDDSVATPLQMAKYYVSNEHLTDRQPLEGLGLDDADLNYPYLMPDGQVFYFASRSDEGYGNYDLYVTRYDSDSKQFYQAENMGYPYNSPANDYMLVINENANIGWFASDRYQPADSVCIYSFVPNESRRTIDYESAPLSEVNAFASLHSIAALPYTQEEQNAKAEGMKRLSLLRQRAAKAQKHDFVFVLNDEKDCYSLDDFSSPEAKQLCQQWAQKHKNVQQLESQLEQMRVVSPNASQQILNLERRVTELRQEVHSLEKAIRKAELAK